jgi:hypothetical protein
MSLRVTRRPMISDTAGARLDGRISTLGSCIESVTMLGVEGELEWRQDYDGLHVSMPKKRPCDHAYTFRINLKEVSR